MGMAASQARFLGLTARKTNVEYEGQQVNQQRTTLANQSASYYNQLLGMTVPTPPSVDQFTKVVYSFTDVNGETCTIDTIVPNDLNDETYKINYNTTKTDAAGYTKLSYSNKVVRSGTDPNYTYKIGEDIANLRKLDPDNEEDKAILAKLQESTNQTCDFYVREEKNPNTGVSDILTYFSATDIEEGSYNTNNAKDVTGYRQGSVQVTNVNSEVVKLETDASGRLINMLRQDGNGNYTRRFALTTSTVKDEDAYEDAMNKYNYDRAAYDKEMDNINSKIALVQAEDKNLELRLKQLDTEQEAIQTEMDAVQKVIQKNTESTFKTFG